MTLTFWLNSEMKAFARDEIMSSHERNQMLFTMMVFCSGYFLQMLKNLISFLGTISGGLVPPEDAQTYTCTHNTYVNLFQFTTYIFEDLLPIGVMLWMHHKNFRETDRR